MHLILIFKVVQHRPRALGLAGLTQGQLSAAANLISCMSLIDFGQVTIGDYASRS